MMLNLVLLLILAAAVYSGMRRGIVLQGVYTGGYLISYIIAAASYRSLAPKLELLVPYPSAGEDSQFVFYSRSIGLELDHAFYGGMAFLLIVLIGVIVTRFLGIFFNQLTFFPVANEVNRIGGGVLCFLTTYVGLFLILYELSFVPLTFVQHLYEASGLARFMVEHTPIFSGQIYRWWVTAMIR